MITAGGNAMGLINIVELSAIDDTTVVVIDVVKLFDAQGRIIPDRVAVVRDVV